MLILIVFDEEGELKGYTLVTAKNETEDEHVDRLADEEQNGRDHGARR